MKVISFNCSPRGNKGNTALILDPFLEGIAEAGAEIETYSANDLEIRPCLGELSCLFRTPGECFQKDDMQSLLPKLRDSDVWIFATPVQIDGVSSSMKVLMERMLPLVEPVVEIRDNHCRYRLREGNSKGEIILVSTCGNWETDNFDPLIAHMKAASMNIGKKFRNALLRPHAAVIRPMLDAGTMPDDIFQAARESGRQLVIEGEIHNETLDAVSRPLMPREMYIETYNRNVMQVLGK